MAIVGSSFAWLWCLTSPVFSVGGVGGGASLGYSVGDVGKAAVGNAVLAPGNSMQLLLRPSLRFGVGVGGCCRCAAADVQFLVGDVVAAPE